MPKAKTEKWNQKFWNDFDQFGITTICSVACTLEVGAWVSLKVATKTCPRGKKKNAGNLQF